MQLIFYFNLVIFLYCKSIVTEIKMKLCDRFNEIEVIASLIWQVCGRTN